jgi:ABC-2 type transport system ATP-binding protein
VDPEAREALLALLASLAREHGMRMILSTHLLADVERLATHAIVLNHGKVAAHGTLDELKRAQTTAYDVRVNGAPQALTEFLTTRNVKWEMHAPAVRVQVDDPREVLRLVKDAGLVVRHLAPATLTLEEAFERAVSETEVSASG